MPRPPAPCSPSRPPPATLLPLPSLKARAATEEAERARKRGRLSAALEGALGRAGAAGGGVALRPRGARAGGGLKGVRGEGARGNPADGSSLRSAGAG